ncbi:MAG: adenylate kinase [Nanoarchaeota archaeon]|nr:adenylate kinase [Nanoarchaeota archaeon]
MKLVFLGPPGAGKGTQANLLSRECGIPHISTGDIFRENIKNNTELGKLAKSYTDRGLLCPDEVTNRMVEKRLKERDCEKGFILDGYPRTIPQAEFLYKIIKLDKVIDFSLPDDIIVERISGRRTCAACQTSYHIRYNKPKKADTCDKCQGKLVQREDERPEVIMKRIEVYNLQTSPLIDFYKKKGLLSSIDARQGIEDIWHSVKKELKI